MLGTRVVSTSLSQKRLWFEIGIQWYELLVLGMMKTRRLFGSAPLVLKSSVVIYIKPILSRISRALPFNSLLSLCIATICVRLAIATTIRR